ncbi:MAG: malto-oligosyltrehalose trehalohydrolase [Nitrospirales bacterium]
MNTNLESHAAIWQTKAMTHAYEQLNLGAQPHASGTRFTVWAPHASRIDLKLLSQSRPPLPMIRRAAGYFETDAPDVRTGDRYVYILDDNKERPDPASRSQPEGVHGPSEVVDSRQFQWTDRHWQGVACEQLIIYEVHVGTVTDTGTFQAIIPHLEYLRNLGITAIELMPVAQFPGTRNWGYDGVGLFAPQNTYGGPPGLKELVNACHQYGLAVILDVVYNHFGPEGNYLGDFGPYFTDRYRTPWGSAINYDGPDSDAVRHFVVSNALYWITEYHIDALRLDAVHGIYDFSAVHILKELSDAIHAEGGRLGRTVLLIAESDLNDSRIISPPAEGGYGMDAQWSDDFHHALHTALTGERVGYYEDFGELAHLATALQDGFVYAGRHSKHRRRRHGNTVRHRPPQQLVICAQNHDQIGNRALGERLSTLVSAEALQAAATAVLLAPQTPMLFMGEEYGETAPFQYFVDHSDADLNQAVRAGRKKEFAAFGWTEVPDPLEAATFKRSRVHLDGPHDERQNALLAWHRRLMHLRNTLPPYTTSHSHHHVHSFEEEQVITIHRWTEEGDATLVIVGMNKKPGHLSLDKPEGTWTLQAASWASEYGGKGERTLPHTITIPSNNERIFLPAYGAAVYVHREGKGHQ